MNSKIDKKKITGLMEKDPWEQLIKDEMRPSRSLGPILVTMKKQKKESYFAVAQRRSLPCT